MWVSGSVASKEAVWALHSRLVLGCYDLTFLGPYKDILFKSVDYEP